RPSYYRLMTQMKPVKDANRQVRRPSNRFQFVDGTQNFHHLGGLSLHRSQILGDLWAMQACSSRFLRLRRKTPLPFSEESFKQFVRFIYSQNLLFDRRAASV